MARNLFLLLVSTPGEALRISLGTRVTGMSLLIFSDYTASLKWQLENESIKMCSLTLKAKESVTQPKTKGQKEVMIVCFFVTKHKNFI